MPNTTDYRDKSIEQLSKLIDERKAELVELINKSATEPSEDVRRKRNLRRDIARLMTIRNQKQGEL